MAGHRCTTSDSASSGSWSSVHTGTETTLADVCSPRSPSTFQFGTGSVSEEAYCGRCSSRVDGAIHGLCQLSFHGAQEERPQQPPIHPQCLQTESVLRTPSFQASRDKRDRSNADTWLLPSIDRFEVGLHSFHDGPEPMASIPFSARGASLRVSRYSYGQFALSIPPPAADGSSGQIPTQTGSHSQHLLRRLASGRQDEGRVSAQPRPSASHFDIAGLDHRGQEDSASHTEDYALGLHSGHEEDDHPRSHRSASPSEARGIQNGEEGLGEFTRDFPLRRSPDFDDAGHSPSSPLLSTDADIRDRGQQIPRSAHSSLSHTASTRRAGVDDHHNLPMERHFFEDSAGPESSGMGGRIHGSPRDSLQEAGSDDPADSPADDTLDQRFGDVGNGETGRDGSTRSVLSQTDADSGHVRFPGGSSRGDEARDDAGSPPQSSGTGSLANVSSPQRPTQLAVRALSGEPSRFSFEGYRLFASPIWRQPFSVPGGLQPARNTVDISLLEPRDGSDQALHVAGEDAGLGGSRRLQTSLEPLQSPVSPSANPPHLASNREIAQRQGQASDHGDSRLESQLVPAAEPDGMRAARDPRIDRILRGLADGLPAEQTGYLEAMLYLKYQRYGLEPEICSFLIDGMATSTLRSFQSPVKMFVFHLSRQNIDPSEASHRHAYTWLKDKFDTGSLAFPTLRHYMWAIRHVLPPPSAVESSIYQSLLKALSIRTGPTLKTHKPVDLDPIMRRIVGINTTTGRWADRAMNILHKVTFLLGFYGFLRPSDVHRAIRANSVINGRRYSGTRFTGNPTTPDLIVSVYGPKERRAGHRIIKEIIIKRADRRFSSLCPVRAMEEFFTIVDSVRMDDPVARLLPNLFLNPDDWSVPSSERISSWMHKFCRGINLRAEGSTAAYNNGSSIGDIVAHANWSSSSMFLEYYKRVRTTQFDMTAGLNAGLNAEFSIESFEEEELLDGSQPQVEGEDDPPLEEATTIDPA